jgi:hypothetical protein
MNVDGSRYALYTQDPQAKLINAHCPLCLAPDSDLHWICECPCPALKEPRDTLLHETILTHLHQLPAHTEQQQEYLLPQLSDLCRALRTGLTNSPHRELLWKGGAWMTNLIASLDDTARANTRINPWRSPTALALLVKTQITVPSLPTSLKNPPLSSLPNPPENHPLAHSILLRPCPPTTPHRQH